jgi:phosphoglycerol transferase MdoB-like AlkP superfamily enzyme
MLRPFLWLLAIYSFVRVLYFSLNRDFFLADSWSNIFYGFLIGLRFDLAIIAGLSLPFVLLIYFPASWIQTRASFHFSIRALFTLVHSAAILSNLVDIEFISTTGRRLNLQTLKELSSDITPQLTQLVTSYAYIIITWLLLSYFVWLISSKLKQKKQKILSLSFKLIFASLLLIVIYRGGLQPKVLHPAHANSMAPSPTTAELALNGPFNLIRTPRSKHIVIPTFFASYDEALSVLTHKSDEKLKIPPLPKDTNVVIFIIESLGAEYMGDSGAKNYTPFLSELRKKSATFFGIANGHTSIESLGPILLGIPSLLPGSYITSMYRNNHVVGIGTNFDSLGYDTSFFHGGQKGTMFFDSYANLAGFKNYYGMEDYPDKTHFDGAWGIYDHYFLDFFGSKQNSKKKPSASVFFSLSTHPPYRIPPSRKTVLSDIQLPSKFHATLSYMDDSFKEFFIKHQNEEWFNDTLFVFTADHTQRPYHEAFMNEGGRKRIPIFFYHPKFDLSVYSNPNKVIQQADIAKSIYELLGLHELKISPLSNSVFDSRDKRGISSFKVKNCLIIAEGGDQLIYHRMCEHKLSGPFDYHDFNNPTPLRDDPISAKRAKALVQVLMQGLAENRLFD